MRANVFATDFNPSKRLSSVPRFTFVRASTNKAKGPEAAEVTENIRSDSEAHLTIPSKICLSALNTPKSV
jgi:hypothetical protein